MDCPIVTFFLSQPGMAADLLVQHVDDGTGHCAGCAWQQAARPLHPCLIRHYATLANDAQPQQRPEKPNGMLLRFDHAPTTLVSRSVRRSPPRRRPAQ